MNTCDESNLADFIEEVGLEFACLPAFINPFLPDVTNMYHWSCKLSRGDQFIVIPFSTDLKMRRWKMPVDSDLWSLVPNLKIGQQYDGPWPFFNSFEEQAQFEECSEPMPPDIETFLTCVGRDAYMLETECERLGDAFVHVEQYAKQLKLLLQKDYSQFISIFAKNNEQFS